ncbi:MAG: hypothetical protein BWZ07_02109 [Alphaproteobacteria bacterium ADurb.BinA280]|nr:MAG: hypothetical protein BWZ07_02109 [Alphaproteobacteria bacterium ADurb.BinA280]
MPKAISGLRRMCLIRFEYQIGCFAIERTALFCHLAQSQLTVRRCQQRTCGVMPQALQLLFNRRAQIDHKTAAPQKITVLRQ